jgi:hypothetical protein
MTPIGFVLPGFVLHDGPPCRGCRHALTAAILKSLGFLRWLCSANPDFALQIGFVLLGFVLHAGGGKRPIEPRWIPSDGVEHPQARGTGIAMSQSAR